MKKIKPDETEREIRQEAFGKALVYTIEFSEHDSIEWLASIVPPWFDFNKQYGLSSGLVRPIISAIENDKPRTIEWLMRSGAILHTRYNGGNDLVRRATEDGITERWFIKLVSTGLLTSFLCSTEFGDFLTQGVCDARLLIHIADFAYIEDNSKKRKSY